jgi:hypothetical protein
MWLEDRPLTSALVVFKDEGGGKGLPGPGWFDFCKRLGLITDDKDLGQQLRVWTITRKPASAEAISSIRRTRQPGSGGLLYLSIQALRASPC